MSMKRYEDIDEALKLELEEAVKSDKFSLNAETLYNHICTSTGPITTLAEIFEVKASVVRKIKAGKFT